MDMFRAVLRVAYLRIVLRGVLLPACWVLLGLPEVNKLGGVGGYSGCLAIFFLWAKVR